MDAIAPMAIIPANIPSVAAKAVLKAVPKEVVIFVSLLCWKGCVIICGSCVAYALRASKPFWVSLQLFKISPVFSMYPVSSNSRICCFNVVAVSLTMR